MTGTSLNKTDLNVEIENKINHINTTIANSYSAFINNLEDIKQIAPQEELDLISEKIHTIDGVFAEIIKIYHPLIRRLVSSHIRTLLAMDKLDIKTSLPTLKHPSNKGEK